MTIVWFYQKNGRGGRIRTADPLFPKQMRYQAALLPDGGRFLYIQNKSASPSLGLILTFFSCLRANIAKEFVNDCIAGLNAQFLGQSATEF